MRRTVAVCSRHATCSPGVAMLNRVIYDLRYWRLAWLALTLLMLLLSGCYPGGSGSGSGGASGGGGGGGY
jgi:uncharacterized membrane protein YgcG